MWTIDLGLAVLMALAAWRFHVLQDQGFALLILGGAVIQIARLLLNRAISSWRPPI